MPIDLRKYNQLPNDWEWAEREEERLRKIGKVTLSEMQNAIYNTLIKVPENSYFDIETNVRSENHEIFIKTVCEFLQYFPDYRFNLLMNRVYHEKKAVFIKLNETDEERKTRQAMERAGRRVPA